MPPLQGNPVFIGAPLDSESSVCWGLPPHQPGCHLPPQALPEAHKPKGKLPGWKLSPGRMSPGMGRGCSEGAGTAPQHGTHRLRVGLPAVSKPRGSAVPWCCCYKEAKCDGIITSMSLQAGPPGIQGQAAPHQEAGGVTAGLWDREEDSSPYSTGPKPRTQSLEPHGAGCACLSSMQPSFVALSILAGALAELGA